MPSQSRDTGRRSFVLGRDTIAAIDEFAAKHNMAESKVVENAILAYTGHSTRRAPNADESPDTKKNKQQASVTEFDPAAYDPTADRDGLLSKDELKQLVALDEPVINPEHVNWKNLFRDVRKNPGLLSGPQHVNWNNRFQDVDKKSTLIAGVCRFENADTITEYDIQEAITTYLGDSTYILNQYTKTVPEEFTPKPSIIFDRTETQYESRSTSYFPTERHREEYYRDRYETITQAVNTPVAELPPFGSYTEPYEYLRQWLDQQQVRDSLQELGIATEAEIDDRKQDLAAYRAELNDCLSTIADGTSAEKFTREEAIEALPYDRAQSERLLALLDALGYICEWNGSKTDLGINTNRLVKR